MEINICNNQSPQNVSTFLGPKSGTFLTFSHVIFLMLFGFDIKISKIACLTIKFSNMHQHFSSKVPFYWRKWSKSSIFTQPSSLWISFLRILDPEIPTFCGLCEGNKQWQGGRKLVIVRSAHLMNYVSCIGYK